MLESGYDFCMWTLPANKKSPSMTQLGCRKIEQSCCFHCGSRACTGVFTQAAGPIIGRLSFLLEQQEVERYAEEFMNEFAQV